MSVASQYPLVYEAMFSLDQDIGSESILSERSFLLLNEVGFSLDCPPILSTDSIGHAFWMLEQELFRQERKNEKIN